MRKLIESSPPAGRFRVIDLEGRLIRKPGYRYAAIKTRTAA
jgi:hypothetical protein